MQKWKGEVFDRFRAKYKKAEALTKKTFMKQKTPPADYITARGVLFTVY